MFLGVYDTYLVAVSTVNLYILVPMGIGLLIGVYMFLKIIKLCLDNFSSQTYYAILGFVLGSIPILYPGFKPNFTGIAAIIFLFLGIYISLKLEKT